ncbi:hypothetical protein L1987_29443 [Smallanthus sonchifolius]|uniref:Uncharacterized protein n=1 Tax=Smallanthus sonchifolius TaxID=185202 RepID=A0ACB9HZH4_9ASTR|nr:hypothetical protein L1987_29443 [Smallanthus sonchifolius]
MLLTGKTRKKRANGGIGGGGEGWGMDIFLVFFPGEKHHQHLTSSSPFKRTNSSQILTRLQSTISICALLIFLTLLLFTLSSFEPNNSLTTPSRHSYSPTPNPRALQRLGTMYTRGTTAMNNLIVCHVTESVTTKQLKLFLRAFHRSGLPSSSDLLFIFNSVSTPVSFNNVIIKENDFFFKVIRRFNPTRFMKSGKKVTENREPVWGKKVRGRPGSNSSLHNCGDDTDTLSTRVSYGSVVSFGVGELDPENSLSGFVDRVPMSLRRWACYPMLLGRVRRHYKHVMLVDVNKVLLLGDPLGRVKNPSPDSVFLSSTVKEIINPAVIMGGMRGIRRLSAAVFTEIVRGTMTQQQYKKNVTVTESSLLRRVATNEFILKSIRISIVMSVGEASSLGGSWIGNETIVWLEKSGTDIESVIMKHICSFSIGSAVYTDC